MFLLVSSSFFYDLVKIKLSPENSTDVFSWIFSGNTRRIYLGATSEIFLKSFPGFLLVFLQEFLPEIFSGFPPLLLSVIPVEFPRWISSRILGNSSGVSANISHEAISELYSSWKQ